MVEKGGIEVLDRNISSKGQNINPEAVPSLSHPDFNKLWTAHKNGSPLNDGFQITNGRSEDWVKELEGGGDHSKADQLLMRAILELKGHMKGEGANGFSKLLDQVDIMPPFQINNLATSGKLGEMFDPKETGEIMAKNVITAIADPNRSAQEHAVALSLMQHFFLGKEQDATVPISEIKDKTSKTPNQTEWEK
jgi:hypothetical protein